MIARTPRPRGRRMTLIGRAGLAGMLLAIAAAAALAPPAIAVTHLKRGMVAPTFDLPTLDGPALRNTDLRNRTFIIVFGELYHDKTLEACEAIRQALADERLAEEPIATLLVVAQDATAAELQALVAEHDVRATVLHDTGRRAFGEYRVAVMPSVVVVDGKGRVVHAIGGYTARFRDILTDALLVATGKLSPEQFDQSLHPGSGEGPSEDELRAGRITQMARQLARRGLDEMAEEQYLEALRLAPDVAAARLGLGILLLHRKRLADAEAQFRQVLARQPQSVEAALGVAYVQTLRGGDELEQAEDSLHDLAAANPSEPRVQYLLGMIHQQRGEMEDAAASFRAAAEMMMTRHETWDVVPGR